MKIKILDILHSDNGKGVYRQSKVGKKYEYRKNKTYIVDFDDLTYYGGLELKETNDNGLTGKSLYTTEYKGIECANDLFEIYTWNSIYVCKVI